MARGGRRRVAASSERVTPSSKDEFYRLIGRPARGSTAADLHF